MEVSKKNMVSRRFSVELKPDHWISHRNSGTAYLALQSAAARAQLLARKWVADCWGFSAPKSTLLRPIFQIFQEIEPGLESWGFSWYSIKMSPVQLTNPKQPFLECIAESSPIFTLAAVRHDHILSSPDPTAPSESLCITQQFGSFLKQLGDAVQVLVIIRCNSGVFKKIIKWSQGYSNNYYHSQ
jgi:hypothetical protein